MQRVSRAAVRVEGETSATIGPGLVVLLGVAREDTGAAADRLAEKVRALRVFADADGQMNEALGEREVLRHEVSRSNGSSGLGESQSLRHAQERLVLASEIAGLPNLAGYLALAGDEPVRRLRLTPRAREDVTEAFVPEDAC